MKRSSPEYPPWVSRILSTLIVGLVSVAGILLITRWQNLTGWRVALYAMAVGLYAALEREGYQPPAETGIRYHAGLRYALALAWWTLLTGAVIEYVLSPHSNLTLTLVGLAVALPGMLLRLWAVRTLGRYFSGHIETWPGQTLIERGPYRVIRHPAYAGNILQVIGLPLILNALFSLVLSAVLVGLFLRRIVLEERILSSTLPGYPDYQSRTSRLIPGVW